MSGPVVVVIYHATERPGHPIVAAMATAEEM